MTEEQTALLKKAKASLNAASLLVTGEFYDFAASRPYYAMFYVAEALLLEEGLTFSKHSAVIAAFGERFVKTDRIGPELHRHLIEGEDIRHLGDYAEEQIRHAREMLQLPEKLIGRPAQ